MTPFSSSTMMSEHLLSWDDVNGAHLSDADVEDYARTCLADPRLASVEEHLLQCERCRSSVEDSDRFIADLTRAARALGLVL